VLFLLARWATATDPQILRLLFLAAKLRREYDPAKFEAVLVSRGTPC